jgi:hypothetical protein
LGAAIRSGLVVFDRELVDKIDRRGAPSVVGWLPLKRSITSKYKGIVAFTMPFKHSGRAGCMGYLLVHVAGRFNDVAPCTRIRPAAGQAAVTETGGLVEVFPTVTAADTIVVHRADGTLMRFRNDGPLFSTGAGRYRLFMAAIPSRGGIVVGTSMLKKGRFVGGWGRPCLAHPKVC